MVTDRPGPLALKLAPRSPRSGEPLPPCCATFVKTGMQAIIEARKVEKSYGSEVIWISADGVSSPGT